MTNPTWMEESMGRNTPLLAAPVFYWHPYLIQCITYQGQYSSMFYLSTWFCSSWGRHNLSRYTPALSAQHTSFSLPFSPHMHVQHPTGFPIIHPALVPLTKGQITCPFSPYCLSRFSLPSIYSHNQNKEEDNTRVYNFGVWKIYWTVWQLRM